MINLVFRLLLAKIQQHSEILAVVMTELVVKGVFTAGEWQAVLAQSAKSSVRGENKRAAENLQEFLTIHNIDQWLQDPPEE